jgi:hypothetical protein
MGMGSVTGVEGQGGKGLAGAQIVAELPVLLHYESVILAF